MKKLLCALVPFMTMASAVAVGPEKAGVQLTSVQAPGVGVQSYSPRQMPTGATAHVKSHPAKTIFATSGDADCSYWTTEPLSQVVCASELPPPCHGGDLAMTNV